MNYLEDMIDVNKSVLDKTLKSFTKNWMIIITGIVYTVMNLIAINILGILFAGPLSVLSGIAFALLRSVIASNYLYLLFNIVNYNSLTIDDFKNGFNYYLRKIYGIFFVLYIIQLLLSMVSSVFGSFGNSLIMIISLVSAVALTALPETVYLKQYDAWESIVYSLNFLKENVINWVIPNLIFYLAIYLITGEILLEIFNVNVGFDFSMNPISMISYVLAQTVFSFMMIYRGHLYKILSTSTRRKRMFMKKI